ncbi:MAG: PEP-CTERM sorting domain-containing protein [Akkermansiaceae bacterium]|nr:PEP-CTERM sorting domain-containing protein [Akkermansiaceae bacterium]
MKTKNQLLSVICVALVTASSASAVTTFQTIQGANTSATRTSTIFLNGVPAGTITVTSNATATGTAPQWQIQGEPTRPSPAPTLSFLYANGTNASTQQIVINYTISLNPGITFAPGTGITIGSGASNGPGNLIGGGNNFSQFTLDQSGTFTELAATDFDLNNGAYTAGTAFTSSSVTGTNSTTAFSRWSILFPQTTSFQFTTVPVFSGTTPNLAVAGELVGITFDVVPEPSSALLGALGALGLLRRRRA